ncbi:major facilitator superfamily domain-containing protein [Sphaerosporella brunnea]|uniref:Major facilitator superfamily domain-containing protein n=1 Tax=Sphaerosporella brunnea TaxID=1250544 RepID=A0A5J5EUE0_9PEZI|nr:major facilitator superfamily domain-containing protein [Sphaerosporella brunnea]
MHQHDHHHHHHTGTSTDDAVEYEDIKTDQTPTDLPILSTSVSHTSHVHVTREEKGVEEGGVEVPEEAKEEPEYPEGGRQAWTVVFGSLVSMTASFGMMNSIGTLHAHLSENQLKGHSEGQIGWIFGVYSFLSFLGGILIGPIFDAFGPKFLMLVGMLCHVVSLMLFSISTQYWHFMLTFGVLCGIATCLIFTPAVASVGHWFLKKRAYATGVATTGGSIGGIMFPLILQRALPAVGFGWAIRIVGFVCLVFLVIGNLLVRARTEVMNRGGDSTSSSSSAASTTSGATPKTTSTKRKRGLWQAISSIRIDLTAFLDPRFSLTTVGVFMIEWAVFIPLTYITSYSLRLGLPSSFSYQLLAVLNVGSVFGRWLPGLVADKTGRFNIMLATVTFCLTTVLGLWLPADRVSSLTGRKAIMVVFALIYGFGSGSGISLTPVCVGQICSTKEYGTKYGTCYFFVSFATLTGIPIAGQIVNATGGSYQGLIIFTAASYVGALMFFGAARYMGLRHLERKAGWGAIY